MVTQKAESASFSLSAPGFICIHTVFNALIVYITIAAAVIYNMQRARGD
jgi:hypothetical protein